MNKIHLDFESRSKVDIWQVGAYAYANHPSTEILCMAYAVDDEKVQILKKSDLGLLIPFEIKKEDTFHAFNSFFEQCMWQRFCVNEWGWPRIPIRQWHCVMAKTLASAYPQSLMNACLAVDTEYKKSAEGKNVMLKMCKPNLKGEWNESKEDFEKLYQYCIDDVMAERSLDKALPDLIPSEQTVWYLDQLINQRGIRIDTEAVKKALQFIQQYTERLNNTVFEQSGAVLDRVTRRQAVLDWCKSQGVEITGYTKTDVTKVLSGTIPDKVRVVLEAKLQLGKTSVAKYQALENATTEDRRLRDTLTYHGATTGRWTGKLFQLQNLPKGTVKDTNLAIKILKETSIEDFEMFYPDVMGTLSSCIRGMIVASPGTELFVGDYSAIEARVVMWLSGENYGLKQYVEGKDLYVDMARRIYGKEEISKKERELGKAVILGCGYGMSHKKFALTCEARGMPVSPELAEKAVNTYRETYAEVRNNWYGQDSASVMAVQTGEPRTWGRVTWSMRGKDLTCKLPSGRLLNYPKATVEYMDTPWGDRKLTLNHYSVDIKNQWKKDKNYGARLVENCSQAVARDILAEAMLRLEKNGYPVIFSVHDEVVCEVPIGKKNIAEFRRLLCELPQWAAGLPLKAECWQGNRYRKD